MRSRLLIMLGVVGALIVAPPAHAKPKTLRSNFTSGAQGWTAIQNLFGISLIESPTFLSTGGNPGGYIEIADNDQGPVEQIAAFRSSGKFSGDLSGYYGGLLKMDLQTNGTGTRPAEVSFGSTGTNEVYLGAAKHSPGASWKSFSIPLVEKSWVIPVAKTHPSAKRFRKSLASVARFAAVADYQTVPGEKTDLDNFKLIPAKTIARKVTLGYDAGSKRFSGHLNASKKSCRAHQPVEVRKVGRGADHLVGTTKTDAKGKFKLHDKARNGTYYAAAAQEIHPPTICAGAQSSSLNVG